MGICLVKNGLRYTILDGTREIPEVIHSDKLLTNNLTDTPMLMNWYETTFSNLLTRFNPDTIGIKVSLNAKKAEISHWYYPLGILHNLCHQQRIPTTEFVSGNFTSSKFDLDKTIKIYDHIDNIFGTFQPKWDRNQKYSVLSAWMLL